MTAERAGSTTSSARLLPADSTIVEASPSLRERGSRSTVLLILIIAAALVLRCIFFVGITGSRDERNEFRSAMAPVSQFPSLVYPPFNRLSLAVPRRVVFRLLGQTELAASLLSFSASVASVLLAYALGTRLFTPAAGLWAAALMAVSPFDLAYAGASFFGDIAVWAYVGVAVLAALTYERHGGAGRCLLAAAAIWMAFRGKEIGQLVAIPLVIYMLRRPRRAVGFALGVAAVLAADALYCRMRTGVWLPDVQAVHTLFGASIVPFQAWDTLVGRAQVLFRGDMFGWFPHLAVASVLLTPFLVERRREAAFVISWLAVFVGALMLKPAGWDPQAGLLTFALECPRYWAALLLPTVVLAGAVADGSRRSTRFSAAVPALVFLVVAVHSVRIAADRVAVHRHHQEWMRWIGHEIRTLPMGAAVVIDQGVGVWLDFHDLRSRADYHIVEIDAEQPGVPLLIGRALAAHSTAYIVTGGPRGIETPDMWRLDEGAVRRADSVATLVREKVPGATRFDEYFTRRDPTRIWKVTRSSAR